MSVHYGTGLLAGFDENDEPIGPLVVCARITRAECGCQIFIGSDPNDSRDDDGAAIVPLPCEAHGERMSQLEDRVSSWCVEKSHDTGFSFPELAEETDETMMLLWVGSDLDV